MCSFFKSYNRGGVNPFYIALFCPIHCLSPPITSRFQFFYRSKYYNSS